MLDLLYILFFSFWFYMGIQIFKRFVYPRMIEADTKEVERNPKWIMGLENAKTYGFQDIDIILAETKVFMSLPRMKITKQDRYEFWISNDTLTKDADEVLRLALMGKVAIKYGMVFYDKPIHWLSILCYMLDGGDIVEAATRFEENKK